MKHILLLTLTFLLSACGSRRADDRPVATVSIEPLRYVVQSIAGDKFSVGTIMPMGASPETYEPTPRQMVELAGSAIIFRCGTLGFEQTKMAELARTCPDVPLVDLGKGIEPIISKDHSHGQHGESADPHVWMSPANLLLMAQNACAALSQADPENANYYRQRLKTFEEEMGQLNKEMEQMLLSAKTRTFLIYHPSLAYLARQYNLRQLAVEHDGKDPSAARLQQLLEQCRAEGVSTVFISKEHSGQTARRLADDLQAHVVEINPLDSAIVAQMKLIAQSLKDGK